MLLAAALAGTVLATVVKARDNARGPVRIVHGVVSTEMRSFFDDPAVRRAFARHGYDVQVVATADANAFAGTTSNDFVFATAPSADRARQTHADASVYLPFSTTVVVTVPKPAVLDLERAGLATHTATGWSLDLARFLAGPNAIAAPDIARSTASAMYALLVATVDNNGAPPQTTADVDAVINRVLPHFLDVSRASPLRVGEEATALTASGTADVVMTLQPDVSVREELVALDNRGSAIGRLLRDDSRLQELAVSHGYRPTAARAARTFAERFGTIVPPNVVTPIDPPAFVVIESLTSKIDAAVNVLATTAGTHP